jgi:adenine phosphoribosyltransferase
MLANELISRIKVKPTRVVILESRGYLLGTIMAYKLGVGFVVVRKQGKLPGDCYRTSFDLEYKKGEVFELQKGILREDDLVLIHDDVLATGGTA